MEVISSEAKIRFWEKVEKRPNGCWIWTSYVNKDGYGMLSYSGKTERSHRFVWMMEYGEIPAGMCICHKCDNPACVNPDHLFLGTQRQNIVDMCSKERQRGSGKGERHHMSKLTREQVLEIRELYESGQYTIRKLADVYPVGRSMVWYIVSGKNWIHV